MTNSLEGSEHRNSYTHAGNKYSGVRRASLNGNMRLLSC